MDWDKLSEKELRDFLHMYDISLKKLYEAEAQRLFTWLMASTSGPIDATYPVLDLYIASIQRNKLPLPNLTLEEINGLSSDRISEYATNFGISPDPVRVRRILRFMQQEPRLSGKQLALNLSYNELSVLTRTSLRFSHLYQNSDFWRDKLLHDYGVNDPGDPHPQLTYRNFCFQEAVNEIPRITPDGGATVIGDGISLTASLEQLKEIFSPYGDVAHISSSCGVFLISYYQVKDAENLITAFNSGKLEHYLLENLKITGPYTKPSQSYTLSPKSSTKPSEFPTMSPSKQSQPYALSPKSSTKPSEFPIMSPYAPSPKSSTKPSEFPTIESEYSDYYSEYDYES